MTRIIISGANGKMGKVIQNIIATRDDCEVVAGVDIVQFEAQFPVYTNINDVKENADAIIDFSHPSSLDSLIEYSIKTQTPLVLATTGFDECQKKENI